MTTTTHPHRQTDSMTDYDFTARRWRARPCGIRWSDMVLGRMACHRTLVDKGEIVVSCYDHHGIRRYTDPVTLQGGRAGSGVLYRIRVRLHADEHKEIV